MRLFWEGQIIGRGNQFDDIFQPYLYNFFIDRNQVLHLQYIYK